MTEPTCPQSPSCNSQPWILSEEACVTWCGLCLNISWNFSAEALISTSVSSLQISEDILSFLGEINSLYTTKPYQLISNRGKKLGREGFCHYPFIEKRGEGFCRNSIQRLFNFLQVDAFALQYFGLQIRVMEN